MRIPFTNGAHIPITVHIVSADITFLVGVEVLNEFKLNLDLGWRSMRGDKGEWEMPMAYKLEHIIVEWKKQKICYTKAKLSRLNLHLFHQSAERLFYLIKKLKHEEAGGELLKNIKELASECQSCRTYSKNTFRFRASRRQTRSYSTMNWRPILCGYTNSPSSILWILSTGSNHTHLKNAVPIRSKRAEDIWEE